MSFLHSLARSLPGLLVASLACEVAMVAAIGPLSDFIAHESTSVSRNISLVGAFMALLALASAFELLLVLRLVWGKDAAFGGASATKAGGEEDDVLEAVRAMRATGTKKALILVVLIVVNVFVFDALGKGVLVTDTRVYRVLSAWRCDDGQIRADAVHDSVILTGDERVARALGEVMRGGGPSREWAAYAAGARADVTLADDLLSLLENGNERERAAAAVALARIKEPRLAASAPRVYEQMGDLRDDIVKAVGMLGKAGAREEDFERIGRFLVTLLDKSPQTRRLGVWALGRFESPQGLAPLEGMLAEEGDLATTCTAITALGRLASDTTPEKFIDLAYRSDPSVRCPDVVYADFTGHEVLLSQGKNLIEHLITEAGRIGASSSRPAMEKIAEDPRFSKTVRNIAGEIAFQLKYRR